MKNKMVLLALCLVWLLVLAAGCSPEKKDDVLENGEGNSVEENGAEENSTEKDTGEETAECLFPEGLVLPQVFILAKIHYTQADLDALQANVIDPLVAYFEAEGQTVVSIEIDSDNRGGPVKNEFIVSVIISRNEGSHEASHLGFVHQKVGGVIPVWEMDVM